MGLISKYLTRVGVVGPWVLVAVLGHCPSIATASGPARDYYEILGVSRDSSAAEITRAYRKLAMKYHPDRLGELKSDVAEATEMLTDINVAYATLGDPEKRRAYSGVKVDRDVSAKATSTEHVEHVLRQLQSMDGLSAQSVDILLREIAADFYSLIDSDDRRLFDMYEKAMDGLVKHQNFANGDILKTLMLMETVQSYIFGLHTHLDFRQGPFPTGLIGKATGKILLKLRAASPYEAQLLLRELVLFSSTAVTFDVGSFRQSARPKWNVNVADDLYEFAVRNHLVGDARSLLKFAQDYGKLVLDERGQPASPSFLVRGQLGQTLIFLRGASPQDVASIVGSLYGESQAIAYEEWVRNGSKENVSAADVLRILKESRVYAEHWKEGRYGARYSEQAQSILTRLRAVNKVFAKDFHRLNPTKQEVQEFISLSGFSWGEYAMARVYPWKMSAPDYAVRSVFEERHPEDEIVDRRGRAMVPFGSAKLCRALFEK